MAVAVSDLVSSSPGSRLPCTPVNFVSPALRRRGLLDGGAGVNKSPLAQSVTANAMLEMNDDEAEKRERRLSKAMEMQQQLLSSPVVQSDRRQSLPLSELTHAQLAEHYADCIKLSTENKISAKNAFGLHLIDYMSELFKKKEVTDFQLASSTLDASAKIYAGRVDAIHTEVYKVLSGLGRGASESQKPPDDEAVDEDGEDKENEMPVDVKEKKRKRAKKSQTIETNLKNITLAKFDLDFELDPAYQRMPSDAADEVGCGCLLLSHLRCRDDTAELMLDYSTIATPADVDVTRNTSASVNIQLLRDIVGVPEFDSVLLCPAFTDFEFMNWSAEGGAGEDAVKSMLDQYSKSEHAFDIDAEPEPVPEECAAAWVGDGVAEEDVVDDGFGPVGLDDECDDDLDNDVGQSTMQTMSRLTSVGGKEAELLETAISSLKNGSINSLIDVLASEPSDYSYFKTDLMRTWAGPEHWKLQPKPKDAESTAGERTKRTKAKEAFVATFDESIDLDWSFKVTKAATTVTKVTLEKHSKQQTTLPEDLHYDADQLMRLSSMPPVMVKWQQNNASVVEVDKYDYDNVKDKCNFCPSSQVDEGGGQDMSGAGGGDGLDDDDDNDDSGGVDFGLLMADDASQSQYVTSQATDEMGDGSLLTGDNLLDVPRKIAKIDIDYAKVAKRIDVKRLKSTMWEVISEATSASALSPATANTVSAVAVSSSLTFAQLLNRLSTRLHSSVVKNLSVPIAFVCLLHLANDKTLKITKHADADNLSDLVILQG